MECCFGGGEEGGGLDAALPEGGLDRPYFVGMRGRVFEVGEFGGWLPLTGSEREKMQSRRGLDGIDKMGREPGR